MSCLHLISSPRSHRSITVPTETSKLVQTRLLVTLALPNIVQHPQPPPSASPLLARSFSLFRFVLCFLTNHAPNCATPPSTTQTSANSQTLPPALVITLLQYLSIPLQGKETATALRFRNISLTHPHTTKSSNAARKAAPFPPHNQSPHQFSLSLVPPFSQLPQSITNGSSASTFHPLRYPYAYSSFKLCSNTSCPPSAPFNFKYTSYSLTAASESSIESCVTD